MVCTARVRLITYQVAVFCQKAVSASMPQWPPPHPGARGRAVPHGRAPAPMSTLQSACPEAPLLGRQHCLHKHGIVIAKQKQGLGGVFPYQGQALISQFPHAAHQPANAQWKRCETVGHRRDGSGVVMPGTCLQAMDPRRIKAIALIQGQGGPQSGEGRVRHSPASAEGRNHVRAAQSDLFRPACPCSGAPALQDPPMPPAVLSLPQIAMKLYETH